MSTCGGGCCAAFTFPSTPEQLRDRWARWPMTHESLRDDLFIADMLIEITPAEAAERFEAAGVKQTEDMDLVKWAEHAEKVARPLYTCRHWDSDTKLCTVYEDRPRMCREYPYDAKCQHDCTCSYVADKEVRTKFAAIRVRSAVLNAERPPEGGR